MNSPQYRRWRRMAFCVSTGLALFALSACKTTPTISAEEQARRDEIRTMLLEMRDAPQQDKKADNAFNAQWERESKEFKDELKADTDAFPNLQVDILVVVNAVAQKGVGCKNPNWPKGAELTSQLERLADNRWEASQRDTPYYRRIPQARATSLKFYDLFTGTALKSRHAFADLALKKGCLDTADHHYRHIMKRYTGSAYAAHRDRAKIGIEDVRAKREQ